MFNYWKTKAAHHWFDFSTMVANHIEKYAVPQYGDTGENLADSFSPEDCVKQVQKYLARFGRNSRPGQEKLDLMKAAHYLQLAFHKIEENEANGQSEKSE